VDESHAKPNIVLMRGERNRGRGSEKGRRNEQLRKNEEKKA
jgi:hypothetical protein